MFDTFMEKLSFLYKEIRIPATHFFISVSFDGICVSFVMMSLSEPVVVNGKTCRVGSACRRTRTNFFM